MIMIRARGAAGPAGPANPRTRGSSTWVANVSILKFIERNWRLKPLTDRSRDNLPNPTSYDDDPYVPTNSPAIGDLFDMFDFNKQNQGKNSNQGGGK